MRIGVVTRARSPRGVHGASRADGTRAPWPLWNAIAGDAESGRRWRAEYLRITCQTGTYRAYEDLVAEAAAAVGLPRSLAAELASHYSEL